MFDLRSLEGVEEVVISKEVVEGTARPLYIYADRADRAGDVRHRRTSLAVGRLITVQSYGPRPAAIALTFLRQQSFGYCPRAKRSRSNTPAGLVGYLFQTAHDAIAPAWQPGPDIRSCELSGFVERTHAHVARKTKGWLEHEFRHTAETREPQSQFRRRA